MISQQHARDILCIEMPIRPRALVLLSLVLSTIFLLCSKPSVAGVIVETEQTDPEPRREIDFIQGHRKKSALASASSPTDPAKLLKSINGWEIIDLDKGTKIFVDYAKKSYEVMPLYPGEDNPTPSETVNYRPTGKRRKVLGYRCNEYRADVDSPKWRFSDFECVSKDPPGAKEYNEFEKLEKSILVEAGYGTPGYQPDGFVLVNRGTGDDAAASRIVLIESKPIPSSEFEVPAGFVKHKIP
jgi:hypothetical protein